MHLVPRYQPLMPGLGCGRQRHPNQPCLANDSNLSLSQRESLVTQQGKLIFVRLYSQPYSFGHGHKAHECR